MPTKEKGSVVFILPWEASCRARTRDGLSCKRSALRNQYNVFTISLPSSAAADPNEPFVGDAVQVAAVQADVFLEACKGKLLPARSVLIGDKRANKTSQRKRVISDDQQRGDRRSELKIEMMPRRIGPSEQFQTPKVKVHAKLPDLAGEAS